MNFLLFIKNIYKQVKPTGAVVCDVPKCSELGKKILIDGGTAVDAAVTTTLCVGLINSHFSGIGGFVIF